MKDILLQILYTSIGFAIAQFISVKAGWIKFVVKSEIMDKKQAEKLLLRYLTATDCYMEYAGDDEEIRVGLRQKRKDTKENIIKVMIKE